MSTSTILPVFKNSYDEINKAVTQLNKELYFHNILTIVKIGTIIAIYFTIIASFFVLLALFLGESGIGASLAFAAILGVTYTFSTYLVFDLFARCYNSSHQKKEKIDEEMTLSLKQLSPEIKKAVHIIKPIISIETARISYMKIIPIEKAYKRYISRPSVSKNNGFWQRFSFSNSEKPSFQPCLCRLCYH